MFVILACCLLATTQAIKVPPESCVNEQGYYPVTQVVDHSCACNAKSAGTLRYRDNKIQFCNGVNYVELGGGNEPELGSKEAPAKSCSEILKERTYAKSGEYYLKQGGATIKVYCYMEEMCGSRGWTMIMKINGKKNTFNFNSKYWTNKETYNVAGASRGLDNTEVKLRTYWRTPFSKLCLGMKTAGKTRWMTLNYRANSLYAVIADGMYRATHSGRAAWKSLISGSSLQRYCNREGFNVHVESRARIGIVNNQENNCGTPDSRLGFGTTGTRCGQSPNNAAGNEARCKPDNGDKSIRSFGYIFAQEQLDDAPLGSFDKPASSCKAMKSARRDAKSGEYYLKQGGATIKAYCFMEEICGSRGWTMIMKIDGKKNTFNFNSKYWTNKETYNVAGASRGLDNTEVKLRTYWRTPFSKLCLGMKTAGKTRWMTLNYRANSLYAVIADGKYRATHSGRAAWKSLISGSSLQRYCNREGFNVHVESRARIGIVNNQENNCGTPDSRLGFGTTGTRCGQSPNNAAGNEARCKPDNGDKSIRSFGYILAQGP